MALNYAALQTLVNREFLEPMTDAVSRMNPFLRALPKKAVASDAIYLKTKLRSNHGARGIADGSDVTVTGTGSDLRAGVLNWVTYVADFSLDARLLAQLAGNPGMLGKLLYDGIQDAGKDLADKLAADVMGSAGLTPETKLAGLLDIFDTDNIYAGIDRSSATNANWRGVVYDNQVAGPAAGPLSTITLDRADTAFFDANFWGLRERAGQFAGFTSSKVLERYQQLATSISLGDLSASHFVNQMNSTGMFGDSVLGYMGIPFVRDRNVAADPSDLANSSRIYFANFQNIALATLTPSAELAQYHQTKGAVVAEGTENLKIEIVILPQKGERIEGYVRTYVQLFSPNPKEAGVVIKNIDIS